MTPDPPVGHMRLGDKVTPALTTSPVGQPYVVSVNTTIVGGDMTLHPSSHVFTISGPQLSLDPSQIASLHPPRDAQGTFHEALPHVALGRRTLPWERELDREGVLPDPAPSLDPSGVGSFLGAGTPWLALLVFVDEAPTPEATVLTQVPLSSVVTDSTIRGRLSVTGDPLVDAIEVDGTLLRAILPSRDEIRLLCHVRQVNVDDRELAAGDSDGWFAVVMASRLPTPGARHRACLVSLEARTDLVLPDPWRTGSSAPPLTGRHRLVLLQSWRFTSDAPDPGGGSFKELAQRLDYGLIGKDQPGMADTGHLPMELHDRAGQGQTAWYRGPLTPHAVARDQLGPYHSADQARRVSPETGAEDISYAAAFELGRLLAAADARLAQEIMAWRRHAYEQSARETLTANVEAVTPTPTPPPTSVDGQPPVVGLTPALAAATVMQARTAPPPSADPTGRELVGHAPGLDPTRLDKAWKLPPGTASGVLGHGGGGPVLATQARGRATRTRRRDAGDAASADLAELRRARAALQGDDPDGQTT
jgi:hypothetical protein